MLSRGVAELPTEVNLFIGERQHSSGKRSLGGSDHLARIQVHEQHRARRGERRRDREGVHKLIAGQIKTHTFEEKDCWLVGIKSRGPEAIWPRIVRKVSAGT